MLLLLYSFLDDFVLLGFPIPLVPMPASLFFRDIPSTTAVELQELAAVSCFRANLRKHFTGRVKLESDRKPSSTSHHSQTFEKNQAPSTRKTESPSHEYRYVLESFRIQIALYPQQGLLPPGPLHSLTVHADLKPHANPLQVLDQGGQFHVLTPLQLGDRRLAEGFYIGLPDPLALPQFRKV